MRWGWKRLFTNTVNMKRNIRAIMSFRVFTPIFLIKVPFLPEWMVGWMKERWVDDTSEATHTRGGTWTKAGITNEQHPLIYHICACVFSFSHIQQPILLPRLWRRYVAGVTVCVWVCVGKRMEAAQDELSYTCTGSWEWLWWDMTRA